MTARRHSRPALAVAVGAALLLSACGAEEAASSRASAARTSSSTPSPAASPTESATASASPFAPQATEPAEDPAPTESAAVDEAAEPAAPSTDGATDAVTRYVAAQDASGADPKGYVPQDHMSGFATKRAMRELAEYQQDSVEIGLRTEGAVTILDAEVVDTGTSDSGFPSAEVEACLDAGDVAVQVGDEPMSGGVGDSSDMLSIPYTANFTLLYANGAWKVDQFWTPESSPC